jgi:hypothetical protein
MKPQQTTPYPARSTPVYVLQTLACSVKDRARKLYVFDREMMLLDKVGGVAIESVDDATAVYYFLQWLHQQRVETGTCKVGDSI